ncbi:MAG: UDP-N-acetylmuramoyl-L-alanyl-D-glutamate--2,6-diaminopimelate ligase [Lachnospiraceae bacterium]|nr:UDP-N-acetylmuramoyl-L-alanyl-D-glutamate--2,6-diaminopimelate ligase [Lachnospiraceae bacterium]
MNNLKKLLQGIEYQVISGCEDMEISDLVIDSRKTKEGCAFLCFIGANSDGHDYIPDVVAKGAGAILIQKDVEVPEGITVIKVEDTRRALALMSAKFFDYPAKKMTTIGITGTKGKTSITCFIQNILTKAGHKVGTIGTIGADVGGEFIKTDTTTPESYDVQQMFAKMVENGCDICVMEVSSQALKLSRVAGIEFDYGMFTNMSPDHIGGPEHKDFAEYVYCKSLLFQQCKKGLLNCDDEQYPAMIQNATCEVSTFSCKSESDLKAENIWYLREDGFIGMSFDTKGLINESFKVSAPGEFSVSNALAAIIVCHALGVDIEIMKEALMDVHVKGRMEAVKVSSKFTVLIDYAHNAMAMEHILKAMRAYNPKRIVSLFGCGGNRSKLRRFEMGETSGTYADFSILTEDNSRMEKCEDIINDIVTGISKTHGEYIIIPDRKEAIKYSILNAQEGDIVLLLGKGHEDYQDKNGKKTPFDERVIIKEILEETGFQYE